MPSSKKSSNSKPADAEPEQAKETNKPDSKHTQSAPTIVGHKNKIQASMVTDPDSGSDNKSLPPSKKRQILVQPADEPEVDEDENPPERILKIDSSDTEPVNDDDSATKESNEKSKTEPSPKANTPKGNSGTKPATETSEPKEEPTPKDTPEPEEVKEPEKTDPPDEEPKPPTPKDKDDKPSDDSEVLPGDSNKTDEDGSLVDELAQQAASKKQQKEQDKQETVREEKITALINDKTYFVPIKKVTKRRIKMVSVLLILLVVLLVGLNLAIDAELLDIGIPAGTNVL